MLSLSFEPLDWPYSVPTDDLVVHATYKGTPLSKARPRFTRSGGVYTPAETRHYEQRIATLLMQQLGGVRPDDKNRFALRCLFYRATRQRIDCDNLLKAISDAATGLIWKDDAQVVEVIGRLFLASDEPRVEIVIYRVAEPAPRANCPTCGKPVLTYPSQGVTYCSMECRNKPLRTVCKCRQCEKDFELPNCYAKRRAGFCSRECGLLWHKNHAPKKACTGWTCQNCGCGVSRKEYTRCRSCSMKHRSDPTSNYWKLRHKNQQL